MPCSDKLPGLGSRQICPLMAAEGTPMPAQGSTAFREFPAKFQCVASLLCWPGYVESPHMWSLARLYERQSLLQGPTGRPEKVSSGPSSRPSQRCLVARQVIASQHLRQRACLPRLVEPWLKLLSPEPAIRTLRGGVAGSASGQPRVGLGSLDRHKPLTRGSAAFPPSQTRPA